MPIHIEPAAKFTDSSAASFQNVMAIGTLSWSSQTPDGFAANALGPQTYDAWVPASMPATLSVLLNSAHECDCAAIIAHTIGSSGATLYVESSLDGTTWVQQSMLTPDNDDDIVILFADSGGEKYPRWRIRMTGSTPPAIGIAWIGKRLIFPFGVQASHTPISHSLDVQLSTSQSITGQYIGSYIERKGGGANIVLAPQERAWVQSDAVPFIEHYNDGNPFIWMSCPALIPEDGHYAWRSGPTLASSFGPGSMWVDMSMQVNAYVA